MPDLILREPAERLRRQLRARFPWDYADPRLPPVPAVANAACPTLTTRPPFNPWVPHVSRVDGRFPAVGVLNHEESALLYSYGRQARGASALEIGCWIGWSTVVLGLAGAPLTVIDPLLGDTPQGAACREALARAGLTDRVELIEGESPAAVAPLVEAGRQWALIFIDGNHEGDAPLRDAQAVVPGAAPDAVILFHDVLYPNVADALRWLADQGWSCGVHLTAQVIGVAWRGAARPVAAWPDPRVPWPTVVRQITPHLAQFPVLTTPVP